MTLTEAQSALSLVDARLAAGVSEASKGDRTVRYDLPALERERSRLHGIIAALTGPGAADIASRPRRVVFRAR